MFVATSKFCYNCILLFLFLYYCQCLLLLLYFVVVVMLLSCTLLKPSIELRRERVEENRRRNQCLVAREHPPQLCGSVLHRQLQHTTVRVCVHVGMHVCVHVCVHVGVHVSVHVGVYSFPFYVPVCISTLVSTPVFHFHPNLFQIPIPILYTILHFIAVY